MKNIFTAIILLFAINTQAQVFQWAKALAGSGPMKMDKNGSIYRTGSYSGTEDFDPGVGVYNLTSTGNKDIFVCKYDNNCNFIWAKSMGGVQDDIGASIAIGDSGNVIITGYFKSTADFDPGVAVFNLVTSNNYEEVFVSKLDSNGNFIWAGKVGSSYIDKSYSVGVDSMGFIYCAGTYDSGADFDPGPGVYNLPSVGGFLLKLDPGGNFIWAKNIGWQATPSAVLLDASQNIHLTGRFYGTCDFDPGPLINYLTSVANSDDIFISKLDANGDFLWAKKMGSTLDDNSRSVCVDHSGNVLTTGDFSGTVDFDPDVPVYNLVAPPNGRQIFILKLDSNGNFVWAKGIGNAADQSGGGICVNNGNEIFSTGYNNGISDFDPGPGVYNRGIYGSGADVYVTKLDSNGSLLYAKILSSTFQDGGGSIEIDPQGSLIFAGFYNGSMDCDPGNAVYTLAQSEPNFMCKWNICSQSNTVTLNFCDSTVYNGSVFNAVCDSTLVTSSPGGCDSITFVHVPVVNHATSSAISYTSCNEYVLNGQTYTASGVYNQLFTNAAGCDSNLTFNFTRNSINTNVSQSGFVLNALQSSATYQWMTCFPFQVLIGEVNQFYTAPGYGEYAVIITMYNPDMCIDTSDCIPIYAVGLAEENKYSNIHLYPNPCADFMMAQLDRQVNHAQLQVVNMMGQVLFTTENISGKQVMLNTSGLKKGIYFVKIYDENNKFHAKFIVE